ncbi:non-reducing end alpha-L-arabinofuranosidase family hydrolase [Streptomyces capitiformicae]|nr:non-reducing end alpha-L-arabinofuranosidase family hydrolase [Streptomyces capitiformicae]
MPAPYPASRITRSNETVLVHAPRRVAGNPFIRFTQATFEAGQPAWTVDFSHGDLIRDGVDQTQKINPCRLGLLTQTSSSC